MKSLGVQSFPVIKPGMEAFDVWQQYFEVHLRWTPVAMRKLIDDVSDKPKEGMTVPTEFPQSFDKSFVEDRNWRAPPPKQLSRLSHETIAELQARYGPTWGIKVIAYQKRAKREWHSPSNEELLTLYGKPRVS